MTGKTTRVPSGLGWLITVFVGLHPMAETTLFAGGPESVALTWRLLEPGSEAVRVEYLTRAAVWSPPEPGIDVLAGPEPRSFAFDEIVVCDFVKPGRALGGASPKFLCAVDGVVYKVKYLPGREPSANREIFAETAATRLFWALGFGADAVFPVRVVCRGCPRDPHAGPTPEERQRGRYRDTTLDLGPATIELRFPGVTIGESDDDGWTWSELDRHAATTSGSAERRAHVEALKLLQVLVQHGDCKSAQQRLVCLPGAHPEPSPFSEEDRLEDDDGTACTESFAFVDDLGATFGGAGNLTGSSAKMSLGHWAEQEVFDLEHLTETGECKARLNVSMSCAGGLEDPIISESGRRFLLERLAALSDEQIRDVFAAARVELLDEGDSLSAWVAVFQDKVRQIAAVRCAA